MVAMSETFPEEDPLGPGPSTGTTVIERTEQREELEPGDHERYAHYVRKEKIMSSALSGEPVIALCGKVGYPDAIQINSPCARPAKKFMRACRLRVITIRALRARMVVELRGFLHQFSTARDARFTHCLIASAARISWACAVGDCTKTARLAGRSGGAVPGPGAA